MEAPKLPRAFEPKATPVKDAWQQQYNRITATEAELVNAPTATAEERETRKKQLINIRILGGFLLHLERTEGIDNVVRSIESCQSSGELVELGGFYLKYFITPFRTSGFTPQPSQHSSQPSFELEREAIYEELSSGNVSHGTAKKAALARDGYRCLVTGTLDRVALEKGPGPYFPTQCCHIIPEVLNNIKVIPDEVDREISKLAGLGQFQEEKKAHQMSTLYTVLKMFGYHVLPELTGTNIHGLRNILTLAIHVHISFDSLNLWFEPSGTGTPHEYKICVSNEICDRPLCFPSPAVAAPVEVVTLKEADRLPPPSPDYLALHAACCRIAHLSGAAEYIDQLYQDFDELKFEARYISSAEYCDTFIEALRAGLATH